MLKNKNNSGKFDLKELSLVMTMILTVFVGCAVIVFAATGTVTLVSPATGTTDWDGEVTFTCNVVSFSDVLGNITLYHNASGTFTNISVNTTPVEGDSTPFTVNVSDAQAISWNCLIENSTGYEDGAQNLIAGLLTEQMKLLV